MTDIKQKKENVKIQLKDLRQNLKKMHLAVTEELILPKPDEIKTLMNNTMTAETRVILFALVDFLLKPKSMLLEAAKLMKITKKGAETLL